MISSDDVRPLVTSGAVLGMGLGGFVDGVLFHQVFQLHHMISAVRPKTGLVNAEINLFWDGLFQVGTWTLTVVGVGMLWQAVRRGEVPLSTRILVGSLLMGWGIFNGVEGVVDHHLLELHHVVERLGVSPWDWAFLGFGVLLVAAGMLLVRDGMDRVGRV